MSGKYPWEAADVFIREENIEAEVVSRVPDVWSEIKDIPDPLPKTVLKKFPFIQGSKDLDAIACKNYLEGRRVPEWVQNMYQVRFDPKRGCLVFAMTDAIGRVFVLRERSIKEKRMWTVSPEMMEEEGEFPKLRDVGVWFGMHMVKWNRPVMLVEGEIKVLRLAALGEFNAIASATSSVSKAQVDALSASTLYLGYDADEAGALAHVRIREMIGERAVLFELDWSIVGRKDPDELKNKKELEVVMKNAKSI